MNMLLLALQILLFVCSSTAQQHQYKVIPENATMEYVSHKYVDVMIEVIKCNQSNAGNLTLTLKCDLPDDAKISVNVYKLVGKDHSVPILHLRKTMKDVLEMELFDLQSLFVRNSRPPMVWPLKKGVTYRSGCWIPDSTKFPPLLPDGKIKSVVTYEFANKTKLFVANAYLRIEYYK